MDEKQIEEMATVMCGGCPNGEPCMHCLCATWYNAEALYKAGYRKWREAEWLEHIEPLNWCEDDVDIYYECSYCGVNSSGLAPYCPGCGSKMKGGVQE